MLKSAPSDRLSVFFVSTYPPRQCGIATFAQDILQNMQGLEKKGGARINPLRVAAIKDVPEGYVFPPEVNFVIREQHREDYLEAAEFINLSPGDVVSLQHEYGIFGGQDGGHIIHLLAELKKPVVTTLHTVLDRPSPSQKETMDTILSLSTLVVVLAGKAVEILKAVHRVPDRKLLIIPHGAPDVPLREELPCGDLSAREKDHLLMTFGLLSANKGIEYVIQALPRVVKEFPKLRYLIVGATHPNVKRQEGEKYRMSLERQVEELDLQQNVVFQNHYLPLESLVKLLEATDIYITPYQSREQISSGTLAYAVACGKAIISTPYWYAQELLAMGRGILTPFKSSDAIGDGLLELLRDEAGRYRMGKKAYRYGRQMIWRSVAAQYEAAFEKAVAEYGRRITTAGVSRQGTYRSSLPEIRLNYLFSLTDDTGIFQHAVYRTPNRNDGYTTDDNARALKVAVMHYEMFRDHRVIRLIHIYLSFLHYAVNPSTNRMRNFMSYNRNWLEEGGSEDCHGRAVWSLGYTVLHAPTKEILSLANQLFKQTMQPVGAMFSPRACAYIAMGCLYYLKRFRGDIDAHNAVVTMGQRLAQFYRHNRTDDWRWFENIVTYANGRLSQALIAAGGYLNDEEMVSQGIESLNWLMDIQTDPQTGYLAPVGNSGWFSKGGQKAKYDQQPIEALCLIDACRQACQATGDERWKQKVDWAFSWFLGKNDKNHSLQDLVTGGCFDGLHRGGVNQNQGGEATLSWLDALHLMYQLNHRLPSFRWREEERKTSEHLTAEARV